MSRSRIGRVPTPVVTDLVVALAAGCGFGGGANVEASLAESLATRGADTASVECAGSDALRYIQDFMKQAKAADTCDVDFQDGTAERFCVVSGASGDLLMVTPDRTCEQTAADYGRGPGLLEPGELEEELESADST
jgi:hypothetical protein